MVWALFVLLAHRCQRWAGWWQHAGRACCSPLSCASLCWAKVVAGGPGAPPGVLLHAAPQRGVTAEGASTVGPAPASGWPGGRLRCGSLVPLRPGQPWHCRRTSGTPPPTAAARATARRRSWITTTGPITLMHSCPARIQADLFSFNWSLLLLQLLSPYLDKCLITDCRCEFCLYTFTSWFVLGLCFPLKELLKNVYCTVCFTLFLYQYKRTAQC